jgi:hypothetical protein
VREISKNVKRPQDLPGLLGPNFVRNQIEKQDAAGYNHGDDVDTSDKKWNSK